MAALGLAPAGAAAQDANELLDYAVRGRAPPGCPAGYAATVRAAEDEGQLAIHSTDERVAAPLVADFRRLYPHRGLRGLNSTELYHRFIAEIQLGRQAATTLWSSAIDDGRAFGRGRARAGLRIRRRRPTCRPGRNGRGGCGPTLTNRWCSRTCGPRC